MKGQLAHFVIRHREVGDNLAQVIGSLVNRHGPVDVIVKPHLPPKTRGQRAYFHGVVLTTIAREKGIEFWKVKEAIRQSFLTPIENPLKHGDYILPSTERLTREEYSDLIEQTLAWAAENGIYIPSPMEAENDHY